MVLEGGGPGSVQALCRLRVMLYTDPVVAVACSSVAGDVFAIFSFDELSGDGRGWWDS